MKSGTFTLSGVILESVIKLQATGIQCAEATLFNEESESGLAAKGSGKLVYTGMKVVEPAGCGISSPVVTEPIQSMVEMGAGTKFRTRTSPVSGEKFVSLKITGCAISGTYPVKGFTVGESTIETGVLAVNQPVIFNGATNELGKLEFGGNPAAITGEVNRELTSGEQFRVT